MAEWLVLAAYGVFASASIVLAVIDIRTRRLPDVIVVPSAVLLVGTFAAASGITGDWSGLVRAVLSGAGAFAALLLVAIVTRGGLGFGDVKLAFVLGVATGWVGWGAVALSLVVAFVLGGAFALVLILTRRATASTATPFGPWLLLGAWVGIATHL